MHFQALVYMYGQLRLPRSLDQLHDLSANQHTLLCLVGKNGLAVHHHVQYTPPG